MPSLGPLEIFLIGAIALIVFGPQKLPEIARNVGRALANLRKMASEVREEFETELAIPEEDRIRRGSDRPRAGRQGPEPIHDKDKDEVLKPGEPGPGDEPGDEPGDAGASGGSAAEPAASGDGSTIELPDEQQDGSR